MNAVVNADIDRLLQFWLGELDAYGYASDAQRKRWFNSNDETDAAIRQQFGELIAQALRGELAHWADTARGRLALIILLDQFTRNVHRGSAAAFAGDDNALQLCKQGLELGHDTTLQPAEKTFFYMPLEHSEVLADQILCEQLFLAMSANAPADYQAYAQNNVDFVRQHKHIIEQFGRFPHRNAALGRDSSAAELAYLKNANTFGQ